MKSKILSISKKIWQKSRNVNFHSLVSEQRAWKALVESAQAAVASASLPQNCLHVLLLLLLCSVPSLQEILNHPFLSSHLLLSVKIPLKMTSPRPPVNCHSQTLEVSARSDCVMYDSLCVSSWCTPGRHSVRKPSAGSELFATLSSIDPPGIDPTV